MVFTHLGCLLMVVCSPVCLVFYRGEPSQTHFLHYSIEGLPTSSNVDIEGCTLSNGTNVIRTLTFLERWITSPFSRSCRIIRAATVKQEGGRLEEGGGDKGRVKSNVVVGSITGEMLYEYYKARLTSGDASVSSLANLEEGGTFRTTCERIGCGHGFQAPEVER